MTFNGSMLILISENDEDAEKHLLHLSAIPFLIGLYNNPQKSQDDERLVLMLLLTIALHGRTPYRKEKAREALLELGIVCKNDLRPVNLSRLCECKECSECMCMAYLLKQEQLYYELDPCINNHKSYWVYRNTIWLVNLVKQYEKLSSSETMTEAFEMFRCTFFMFSFIQLFDGCSSVQILNKLLTKFIEISTDTYKKMNPIYAQWEYGREGEEPRLEVLPQDIYVDALFLQEHDARHMHIVQVLQCKMSASTTLNKHKTLIHEMLKRVEVLNAMLHAN
jgi:hypothetical protein